MVASLHRLSGNPDDFSEKSTQRVTSARLFDLARSPTLELFSLASGLLRVPWSYSIALPRRPCAKWGDVSEVHSEDRQCHLLCGGMETDLSRKKFSARMQCICVHILRNNERIDVVELDAYHAGVFIDRFKVDTGCEF